MEQRQKEILWETVRDILRNVAKEILGETSGIAGKKRETWWWSDKVQKAVEKERDRYLNRCEETIREYKKANKEAKKEVAIAKNKAYKELYESLKGADGEKKAIRIAKQRNRESQDKYQAKINQKLEGKCTSGGGRNKEQTERLF